MPRKLNWVPKYKIARACKISQPTLARLFELDGHPEPRADNKHSIMAWMQFAHDNVQTSKQRFKNGHKPEQLQFSLRTEKEKSAIERNNVATRREAFKLDVEMGEYIPREIANREVRTCNAMVVREINKAIESELPPRLEGLTALEIKKLLRKRFDSIFENLHEGFVNSNGNARE